MLRQNKKRIYLDFASSTPLDRKMFETLPPAISGLSDFAAGANPGALHQEAVAAKAALEFSRKTAAGVLSAHPDEIIFTSGATESNSLAIIGAIKALKNKKNKKFHAITTAIEHPSVIEAFKEMEKYGLELSIVAPTMGGVIDPKEIKAQLKKETVMVSCIYAQNEIGTIQPIKEIAKVIRDWKAQNKENPEYKDQEIIFHVDATQAAPYLALNILQLHADLLTIGSSKLYGPKGVGLLFRRRGLNLAPIHFGGSQEFGLRPGTVPVILISQFAHALEYAQKIREKESARLKELQEHFEENLLKKLLVLRITAKKNERLPSITHVALTGIDSELLVIELDARGIAVSSKSACKVDESGNSSILNFLYPGQDDLGVVRFSFGRTTTKKELEFTVEALVSVIEKYKHA